MAQMFDRINFMSRQRYPSFSYVKPAPTHQNLAVKHDQSIHLSQVKFLRHTVDGGMNQIGIIRGFLK